MNTPEAGTFDVGSLVRARGREWVVQPESDFDEALLVLRPLGGADDEITGIDLHVEPDVQPAEFALPDPARDLGSHVSASLLRDAVRLGFRSGAGPFRCLGGIAIQPRPYQLVPLLLALRQDPIRLLIADDVGIGKTIESLLIARELWDRGEITSMAVLCPPHLAEQWQRALVNQFHLPAALVLPGTARTLERRLQPGETLFERHPVTVISLDWIKTERRRLELFRSCPDLVIVDEAHTCTPHVGLTSRSKQQQRWLTVKGIAEKTNQLGKQDRHLILVTATPHSGREEDFRALLSLLDPDLAQLPSDLTGDHNRAARERIARHLVQRRRGDIVAYAGEQTNFPKRESSEEAYALSKAYLAYFDKVLEWCREQVEIAGEDRWKQRVRWWSALALLRAIGSSPAAAAATLRNRAASAAAESEEEADQLGLRMVLDQDSDSAEAMDVIPGSIPAPEPKERAGDDPVLATSLSEAEAARLHRLAKQADALKGKQDHKLRALTRHLKTLVDEGFAPIVFCRFIPTVDYVVDHLRQKLKGVEVTAVTGTLPPDEREDRVQEAGQHDRRVLVCTDCLSEGINLQDNFDTVVHYDLAWNPTRHEQREGRVDRYGQRKPVVRTLTWYGRNNPVDGLVLDVLIRKHKAIQKQLGIAVPVPSNTSDVVEALMKGLILRQARSLTGSQMDLPLRPKEERELDIAWEEAAEREKRSRSLFAQASIRVDEVEAELRASRKALGDPRALERFVTLALRRMQLPVERGTPARVDLSEAPPTLLEAMGRPASSLTVSFDHPPSSDSELLSRTHPVVAGLARHVFEAALDPETMGERLSPARRLSVVQTRDVSERTTLLLLRLRFHLTSRTAPGQTRQLLAEEAQLVAFTGRPRAPVFLDEVHAEALLEAQPATNITDDVKAHHLGRLLDRIPLLETELERIASERAEHLLEAHRRVRKAGRLALRDLSVEPHLPVDLLGLTLYLPEGP